jgi:hypothetical protein
MASNGVANFSAPPQTVNLSGFLFDMDGTIIDSTEAVEKHWHRFELRFCFHNYRYIYLLFDFSMAFNIFDTCPFFQVS